MRIVRGFRRIPQMLQGCVATVGNFDGVHCGHQLIIGQVNAAAKQMGLPSVVIMFEPQPREYFEKDAAPPRIMPLREKLLALCAEGVDVVCCIPFNERFRCLTGAQFIETVLLDALHIRHLVIGDDFRFGCDRAGDFKMLQQVGERRGFTVEQTHSLERDGERVSSTGIRACLEAGEFAAAQTFLGRPFRLGGRVAHGQKLGRTLGVPTVNIELKHKPPLSGVYVVSTVLPGGREVPGVANVGYRPTVKGRSLRLEVHLLDFQGNLYGQRLNVYFQQKLRDEQRFAGVDALKAQLERDIVLAKQTIASRRVP